MSSGSWKEYCFNGRRGRRPDWSSANGEVPSFGPGLLMNSGDMRIGASASRRQTVSCAPDEASLAQAKATECPSVNRGSPHNRKLTERAVCVADGSCPVQCRDRNGNESVMDPAGAYDVLILGGGNAGLCAALRARRLGARVLVLEAAPKHFRGGNSRHTRNLRCMHDVPVNGLTDSYPESEYWADLVDVTGGHTNEALARVVIRDTAGCRHWMSEHGVRFQPSLAGTLQLSRTNAFFLGGGKALMNAYYRVAEGMGIDIQYDAEVCEVTIADGRVASVVFAERQS